LFRKKLEIFSFYEFVKTFYLLFLKNTKYNFATEKYFHSRKGLQELFFIFWKRLVKDRQNSIIAFYFVNCHSSRR